ncbi:MAG TPA: AAA family ATPase [Tepidisphaeraceae bacterium]|jgi:predicted AAA+ superfamily ATPase
MYPVSVKEAIQKLLVTSPVPRDALPYTPEFERLKKLYVGQTHVAIGDHDFWQLLSKIGKYGGAGGKTGRKSAPATKSLTTVQQLEMLRLFPDGIGQRDNLPYTKQFDDLHKQFAKLTGLRLTSHEFWRATSRVAKLSRKPKPLFETAPLGGLPLDIVQFLERTNPWWRAQPLPTVERYRRSAFDDVLQRIDSRIAPVVAMRGPRQVGKTTIQLQLIEELLLIRHVNPAHIIRVQFDDTPSLGLLANPIEAIVRWYEDNVLHGTINASAARGDRVYLLFDEVQNLAGWSSQLKHLVDNVDAFTLVTGSSALKISRGQDNLAGRLSTIELGPFHLSEIAGVRKLGSLPRFHCPDARDAWSRPEFWLDLISHSQKHSKILKKSFSRFSDLGGYPVCHKNDIEGATTVLAGQLVEDVVNKSIENDPLRIGSRGHLDRRMIREVFRLLCRYAGQGVTPRVLSQEIGAVLGAGIKESSVAEAVDFLNESLLIRLVPPAELLQRKQSNPPRICLCDHFVRNAWLQENIPLDPDRLATATQAVSGMAGHLIESVLGYQMCSIPTLEVAWNPARANESEIDFLLTLGLKRVPIEIKYHANFDVRDIAALEAFCTKPHYNAKFGLIVTQTHAGKVGERTIAVPASALLLAM